VGKLHVASAPRPPVPLQHRLLVGGLPALARFLAGGPRVFSRWGLASDLDNVGTRLGTFHGTVVYDAMDLPKKVYILTITLTGAGMFRR
jgi:hypothetical protein